MLDCEVSNMTADSTPREITATERSIVERLLSHRRFSGTEELRQQFATVEFVRGCNPGFIDLELIVDKSSSPPTPYDWPHAPIEAAVARDGRRIGTIGLQMEARYLYALEYISVTGDWLADWSDVGDLDIY